MIKKILTFFLFSTMTFAHDWGRYNYRPYYSHYDYRPRYYGVSPGAATAIGIGAGIVGYVVGSEVSHKVQKSDKIECQDFPIRVVVEGKEAIGTIKKCRVNNGPWQIVD